MNERPKVYSREFKDPYKFDKSKEQLLFENLPAILKASATDGVVRICVVYAMDITSRGLSLDGMQMAKTGMLLERICKKLDLKLEFESFASWECDDLFYQDQLSLDGMEDDFKKDIQTYYPNSSLEDGFGALETNQESLEIRAIKKGLCGANIIVIGSPKVNKVATNLCEICFSNYKYLDKLGLYAFPNRGNAPLLVTQQYKKNGIEQKFTINEHDEGDLDYGWLQMMRNPWTPDIDRFLIQFAGFFQQGTLAANWKLNQILEIFAESPFDKNPAAVRGQARTQAADFQTNADINTQSKPDHIGTNDDPLVDYLRPTHIIQSKFFRPKNWFNRNPRQRQLRFPVPPGFEGSIVGCVDVIPY